MKWPWVARWRYDQMAEALFRADAARDRWGTKAATAAGQAAAAQQHLDNLLVALGVLDSDWMAQHSTREAWAVANLNYVLAVAVQFRETEQAGGMKGTGYINGLVDRQRHNREHIERRLP